MKKSVEAAIAIAAVAVVALAGWDLFRSDETPEWAVLMGIVLVAACVLEAARRFWIEFPKPTRAPFELTRSSVSLMFVTGSMLVVPVMGLWEGEGDPVIGAVMFGVGAGSLAVLIRHLRKPIDPDTTSEVA
ncbi:MAG TPA: hypothetical protein VM938_10005 [Acidimicrobiales bacterium]|nr:hypothetical protein [Acidimicrobiales bacterium]